MVSPLCIATSARAIGKSQHYCHRYEPSRLRYPAYLAVDYDHQADDEEDGDEGDVDVDYDEQEEEVL